MLIRAYHGYLQGPYGDFMDDLKAEAVKFLQAQAAPVIQQVSPQPAPVAATPQPVQRAMLASATAPASVRPNVSPIVLIGLAFLAYKMLKKR